MTMKKRNIIIVCGVILVVSVLWYASRMGGSWFAYPMNLHTFGPGMGPALPLKQAAKFLKTYGDAIKVNDIARDPNDVPPPLPRRAPTTVEYSIATKEVLAEIAPGITMDYWTFDGTVPGPFLRVREGDTVKINITNDAKNLNHHNIDLHATTGPGGGASVTNVAPGETKTLTWKALNPGLYVYHCAHPNIATHMAHGMYGLILVEPAEGLPVVDEEYYVMQGELYSTGALGKSGLQIFDAKDMLDGHAQYIVFNGRVGGINDKMETEVGKKIRVFFGNGGVNLISSFHVVGEIFDYVYPEGAIGSDVHRNIQTTLVPAGGAVITDFATEVPGNYVFVDHALARLDRGAWGVMKVTGAENPEVYSGVSDGNPADHGH